MDWAHKYKQLDILRFEVAPDLSKEIDQMFVLVRDISIISQEKQKRGDPFINKIIGESLYNLGSN